MNDAVEKRPRGVARVLDLALSGQEDPTTLGLYRVLFVGLITIVYLAHAGSIAEYFSSASMLNGEWARQAFPSRWSIFFRVDAPSGVAALFWLGAVVHIAWLVGLGTRVAGPAAMLMWVSMMGRNPLLYAYPDRVALILGLLLALMPAGRGLSLDAYLRRRAGKPEQTVPVWCRRVFQLQLGIVYTATGLEKSGVTWTDEGTAIYYSLVNPYNRHFDWGGWLAKLQPWLLRPATYLVLMWEVGFAGFVVAHWVRESWLVAGRRAWARWIPDLRWAFLGFGVLMHLAIQSMVFVVHFSWLMMFSYVVFLTPDETRGLLARSRRMFPGRGREQADAISGESLESGARGH